ERHALGPDLDRFAGARVTPGPGRTAADREGAEAAQLHAAAALERLDHLLENDADDAFDVLLGQVRVFARQSGDHLGLDHPAPPPGLWAPLPNRGGVFKGRLKTPDDSSRPRLLLRRL